MVSLDIMAPASGQPTVPAQYTLYGVLYHRDQSASVGHYTVDILHPNARGVVDKLRSRPGCMKVSVRCGTRTRTDYTDRMTCIFSCSQKLFMPVLESCDNLAFPIRRYGIWIGGPSNPNPTCDSLTTGLVTWAGCEYMTMTENLPPTAQ
jgi:hypothetical protein